jgi:serine/threonine protein kinase
MPSILLDDDWRIKITDFGSAKVVDPITLEPVELPEGPYGVRNRAAVS